MSKLDLDRLTAAHYSLLAQITSKNVEGAQGCRAAVLEEAEGLEVEGQMVELESRALAEDAARLRERSDGVRTQASENETACKKLREDLEHFEVRHEFCSKYDALLEDLAKGKSLQELEEELKQELAHQSKKASNACDTSELDALKVHLSQLYDIACIASQRCKHILSSFEGEDAEKANEKVWHQLERGSRERERE